MYVYRRCGCSRSCFLLLPVLLIAHQLITRIRDHDTQANLFRRSPSDIGDSCNHSTNVLSLHRSQSWSTSPSASARVAGLILLNQRIDPNTLLSSANLRFADRSQERHTSYDRGVRLWQGPQDAHRDLQIGHCPLLTPAWNLHGSFNYDFQKHFKKHCEPGRMFYDFDEHYHFDFLGLTHAICATRGCFVSLDHTACGFPNWLNNTFAYINWVSAKSRIIVASNNRGKLEPREFTYRNGSNLTQHPEHQNLSVSEWPRAPHSWAETTFTV